MSAGTAASPAWLVAVDVTAIFAYLTESVRLREIAGASLLLEELREWIDAEVPRRGGWIVRNAGGAAEVLLPTEEAAREFGRDAARHLAESTAGAARLVCSDPVPRGDAYGNAIDQALHGIDREKHRTTGVAAGVDLPHALLCSSCAARPADAEQDGAFEDERYDVAGNERFLCAACRAKRAAYVAGRHDHPALMLLKRQPSFSGRPWAPAKGRRRRDFTDLVGEGQYLTFVVADIDGLGEQLDGLKRRNASALEFRAFAQAVSESFSTAVATALEQSLATEAEEFPAAVLYQGGDDLFAVIRSDCFLEFACSLLDELQAETQRRLGNGLSLSLGGIVAKPTLPIRQAHALARGLLRRAKRARRRSGSSAGMIDFTVVTESVAPTPEQVERQQTYSVAKDDSRRLVFTARPFDASTLRKLRGALQSAVRGAAASEGVARSKLFELRQLFTRNALIEEGLDGGAPDVADFHKARAFLEAQYADWRRRTLRRAETSKHWQRIEEALRLTDGKPCRLGSSGEWIYPLGDLADLDAIMGD
jgi:hypothetical protein